MRMRKLVFLSVLALAAPPALADGAPWYGTFVNKTTVPVTVQSTTTECWYVQDFQPAKTIAAGATQNLNSTIKATWPDCYYNDTFRMSFTMTPEGQPVAAAALKAEEIGGEEYCLIQIPGLSSPAQQCLPDAIRSASSVYYTVNIFVQPETGQIGYTAIINNITVAP